MDNFVCECTVKISLANARKWVPMLDNIFSFKQQTRAIYSLKMAHGNNFWSEQVNTYMHVHKLRHKLLYIAIYKILTEWFKYHILNLELLTLLGNFIRHSLKLEWRYFTDQLTNHCMETWPFLTKWADDMVWLSFKSPGNWCLQHFFCSINIPISSH